VKRLAIAIVVFDVDLAAPDLSTAVLETMEFVDDFEGASNCQGTVTINGPGEELACFGVAKLLMMTTPPGPPLERTFNNGDNEDGEADDSPVLRRDGDNQWTGLLGEEDSQVKLRAAVDFGDGFDPTQEIITAEIVDHDGDTVSIEMGPFELLDGEQYRFRTTGSPRIDAKIDVLDCRFRLFAKAVRGVSDQDAGMTIVRLITSVGTGEETVEVVERASGVLDHTPDVRPDCCSPDPPALIFLQPVGDAGEHDHRALHRHWQPSLPVLPRDERGLLG
jgi:hypothetical protein